MVQIQRAQALGLDLFVEDSILTADVLQLAMATRTQRDQIGILIRAMLTASLLVVNLQIVSGATDSASPVVPCQDLATKLFVRVRI